MFNFSELNKTLNKINDKYLAYKISHYNFSDDDWMNDNYVAPNPDYNGNGNVDQDDRTMGYYDTDDNGVLNDGELNNYIADNEKVGWNSDQNQNVIMNFLKQYEGSSNQNEVRSVIMKAFEGKSINQFDPLTVKSILETAKENYPILREEEGGNWFTSLPDNVKTGAAIGGASALAGGSIVALVNAMKKNKASKKAIREALKTQGITDTKMANKIIDEASGQ